ncbi:MAG: SpoIVB peptidase, partial [Clostridia bacterium]|nr:SpoIVB peptidase [Clostridia bacterium]
AKPGKASIYCTVEGTTPKEYDISIVKADRSATENKDLVVKITDDKLIEKTGGILQGMSGSPIVQNGKIVGAITHVFLNDPTRGFGISIDKMLKE